jgi:hypothetical protein
MVFISYSHDSDSFCDQVLELSDYLRSQGVDCNIDQYEESPPEGWPKWIEKQIREAEYVLVVCSEPYLQKASLQTAPSVGLGVKWETSLIENLLYEEGCVSNKFIPIVFSVEDEKHILTPLKGFTFYNLKYPLKKQDLVNRLLGIKKHKKPPLGKRPSLPPKNTKEGARLLVTSVIDVDLWNKASWNYVGYASYEDKSQPPLLGLAFKNQQEGLKIFSDWKKRFGDEDVNDEISIHIIEEDDSDSYCVCLSSDLDAVKQRLQASGISDGHDLYISCQRWHRMEIVDPKFKDLFKRDFEKSKCFDFVPFVITANGVQPIMDLAIRKKRVTFRKLSEVKDEKDMDYLVHTIIKEREANKRKVNS